MLQLLMVKSLTSELPHVLEGPILGGAVQDTF